MSVFQPFDVVGENLDYLIWRFHAVIFFINTIYGKNDKY